MEQYRKKPAKKDEKIYWGEGESIRANLTYFTDSQVIAFLENASFLVLKQTLKWLFAFHYFCVVKIVFINRG